MLGLGLVRVRVFRKMALRVFEVKVRVRHAPSYAAAMLPPCLLTWLHPGSSGGSVSSN